MRIFCRENADALSRKRVGIFLCCAFSEKVTEYTSKNFPLCLLEHAVVIKAFGADARNEKMKVIDKMIMKAATKGNNEALKISYERMDDFIKEISKK